MSSTQDWWARKLSGQPRPPAVAAPPERRSAAPPARSLPAPTARPVEALPPVTAPNRVRSSQETDTCPECLSGNYFAPADGTGRKRCFDCGYPIIQQGSGAITNRSAPSRPARQVASGGWNPQVIIGRIE